MRQIWGRDTAYGNTYEKKCGRRRLALALAAVFCLTACGQAGQGDEAARRKQDAAVSAGNTETADTGTGTAVTDPEGMTLETRFLPPEGYVRTEAEEGSLAGFLRSYPLKEDGEPVLLYDGTPKGNQSAHAAVWKLPIEDKDLQQCADSVIRVYAEYFWSTGQYDRIAFHFTNGFYAEYGKWRDGCRIAVDGNDVSWVGGGARDDSYEAFQEYLQTVFTYAGTLSMTAESREITPEDIQAGDVFLYGGSPGHVVMVADVCVDQAGEKAFLLAQGYMPAQEFHVLKNPEHESDPWYYAHEISYPFRTPEYVFQEGSLRRLDY